MSTELSLDDFKNVTFELFLAQREITSLRQQLAEKTETDVTE